MLQKRTTIRDFYGRIIGYIDLDTSGDKIIRDFYGKILGRYDKKLDLTRDFYGKILAHGDQSSMLFNMTK
jgi:hypothetical protein